MRSAAGLLVGLAVLTLLPLAPAALADERIEGIVRDAVVTLCDATRRGGCAGTLTLERRAGERTETFSIDVPLGTPISRSGEHVLLHALEGQTVIVTQINQRGRRVARAIEVAESPRAEPAAGSTSRDVC